VDDGNSLAAGLPWMDGAHEVQATLVDSIEETASRGDRREVQDLLLRLVEETADHFALEHDMMRSTGFPEREAHVEEHDRLLRQVSALLESYAMGEQAKTLDLARTLRGWLAAHIHGKDRALAEFLLQLP
jgi:hemerythrin